MKYFQKNSDISSLRPAFGMLCLVWSCTLFQTLLLQFLCPFLLPAPPSQSGQSLFFILSCVFAGLNLLCWLGKLLAFRILACCSASEISYGNLLGHACWLFFWLETICFLSIHLVFFLQIQPAAVFSAKFWSGQILTLSLLLFAWQAAAARLNFRAVLFFQFALVFFAAVHLFRLIHFGVGFRPSEALLNLESCLLLRHFSSILCTLSAAFGFYFFWRKPE